MEKRKEVSEERVLVNYIREYWEKIETKEIIVGKKIYKTYTKVIYDLDNEDSSEYEFNINRAQHAIDFIQKYCRHSKGKMAGKPFILELWQKALVSVVFGFIHKVDETRKYREAMLIVARKNGKSALASAIALYMMIADQEAGAEIYSAATKRDQAKIVWEESKRMVNKSKFLSKKIKVRVAELYSDFNDSTFKPLSSESNTLDGLNVHCSIIDELHAIKDKNLYDVIIDGMAAREQPLSIITTTAGTVRENIYDLKYDEVTSIINGYFDDMGYKDETTIAFVYEIDSREEWKDETCWIKANPGLGTIKNIDTLRSKVNKAKNNSYLVRNLLTKDFNIPENDSQTWLTLEDVENLLTYNLLELKPRYGIGGVDLSSNVDLTSACVLFRLPNDPTIYFKHMYWMPEEVFEQRLEEDKVPYDIWLEKGYLRLCEGNVINTQDVVDWFVEVQQQDDIYMYKIGYDSWGSKLFVNQMEGAFGKGTLELVVQKMRILSAPMKNLGAQLKSKMVNYDNNPITKWCLTNVAVITDKNENIKPAKTSNPRRRIDGFASMLDAYVVYLDEVDNYMNII